MREVDSCLQQAEISLPAVFTVDLCLNTPRFANVKNIFKAKKKPIQEFTLENLSLDNTPRIKVERFFAPKKRAGGVILTSDN